MLAVAARNSPSTALWPIAVLAVFAVAMERVQPLRRRPVVTACLEAAFTGAAVAATGGGRSALLPYLLAPGLALGLAGTIRDVGLATAAATAGLVVGTALYGPPGDVSHLLVDAGLWVLLGLAFGIVAGWAQRLSSEAPERPVDRYVEAHALLEQLRGVTRRLPGGLDLASSAQALLEECSAVVATQRSAVLVQTAPGALVPAAVRGTARVPWRTPLSSPGPLQTAWEGRRPVVDRRLPDVDGRRRGSALAVLPLTTGEGPFGLLILETFEHDGFPPEELERLEQRAAAAALRLETALLFDEVRSTVSIEERDRLAREMHDGVAQELAYVGYQLDDLRAQAARLDGGLAANVADVRKGLTRLISDIRLSITDLRTSVSSDRGLGAAISGYVRAIGSGSRIAVHVTLQESAFRLPGDAEVLLFQVTQAVAQDARRTGQAGNLWVTLAVDPPSARLCVEHDGPAQDVRGLDLAGYAEQLTRLGGELQATPGEAGGVRVEVVLHGGRCEDHGPAGR